MKFPKLLYPSFLCLLIAGCDMIDYHPYDVHISGETDVNAHNIAQIEQNCQNKTTIRFVTMGDSQRWYDETDDFVGHLNKRDDIDFVIHGGDVSDFGVTDEFLWQRDIMNKLKIPYVVLLGNHDCLGTGEETYRAIFGDPNFSFIAGRVKFVCLNTNAIEFDYSRPIPDFEFLAAQIRDREEEFDKTVVSMHIRPFCNEFNNNVAHVFQRYIKEFPGLQFCTSAHEHHRFEKDLFEDGIMYYMSDCMKNRNYYIFTITPTDMNAKWHIINHLACAVVFLSVCSFSAFSQERDTIFIIEHDTVWMDLQPDAVIESQTRENRYDRRVHRYRRHWEALIPTHTKIQFAGNMGLLSFGTGWDYGRRNQWETDVFFGVLPKYDSKRTKLTFTVKQNYLPWSLQIKQSRFSVEPLACGMYLNTVFGDEFWVNEPERYPKGYYGFSSKVRIHAFLGQRITYDIDPQRRFTAKEITFFYEISTCDLYVVSAFTNKYLKPKDYLSLSFGIKLQLL